RSFASAVAAQKVKQLKGLDNLEKKLLRAEKRRHADILARACSLKEELFPGGGLQERKANFAEVYKEYGSAFLQILQDELLPLESDFKILVLYIRHGFVYSKSKTYFCAQFQARSCINPQIKNGYKQNIYNDQTRC